MEPTNQGQIQLIKEKFIKTQNRLSIDGRRKSFLLTQDDEKPVKEERKSIFSLEKKKTSCFENLKQEDVWGLFMNVLQKPSESRDEQDLDLMIHAISDINFIKNLAAKDTTGTVQRLVCKHMNYEYFKKDSIVFRIGDIGDKFYLILKGAVRVMLNLKMKSNSRGRRPSIQDLSEVKLLVKGETFGELALIDDAPRLATILCKEDTHFAILDKKNYKSILQELDTARINGYVSFFQSINLWSKFSKRTLVSVLYPCQLISFPQKKIIYREGDESDKLYVILSGIVLLSPFVDKKIKLTKKIGVDIQKFEKAKTLGKERIYTFRIQKTIKIATLTVKESFGEEELINNGKRKYTITCLSDSCQLYCVPKDVIIRRLKESVLEWQYFNKYVEEKKSWRENLLNNISNNIKDISTMQYSESPIPKFTKEKFFDLSIPIRTQPPANYSTSRLKTVARSSNHTNHYFVGTIEVPPRLETTTEVINEKRDTWDESNESWLQSSAIDFQEKEEKLEEDILGKEANHRQDDTLEMRIDSPGKRIEALESRTERTDSTKKRTDPTEQRSDRTEKRIKSLDLRTDKRSNYSINTVDRSIEKHPLKSSRRLLKSIGLQENQYGCDFVRSPEKIAFDDSYKGDKTIFNQTRITKMLNEDFIRNNQGILEEKLSGNKEQNTLDMVSVLNKSVPRHYLKFLGVYDRVRDKNSPIRRESLGYIPESSAGKLLYEMYNTRLKEEGRETLQMQEPKNVFVLEETKQYYKGKKESFMDLQRKNHRRIRSQMDKIALKERRRTLTPNGPKFENETLRKLHRDDIAFKVEVKQG